MCKDTQIVSSSSLRIFCFVLFLPFLGLVFVCRFVCVKRSPIGKSLSYFFGPIRSGPVRSGFSGTMCRPPCRFQFIFAPFRIVSFVIPHLRPALLMSLFFWGLPVFLSSCTTLGTPKLNLPRSRTLVSGVLPSQV